MDHEFWHTRWQENRIGFHQPDTNPLLVRHWPAMQVSPGARVLVPLCGKSLDLLWLLEQDLQVTGVEISRIAVEALFAEFADASEAIAMHYEKREYSKAMRLVMALADKANRYIDEHKPWVMAKDESRLPEVQAEPLEAPMPKRSSNSRIPSPSM